MGVPVESMGERVESAMERAEEYDVDQVERQ